MKRKVLTAYLKSRQVFFAITGETWGKQDGFLRYPDIETGESILIPEDNVEAVGLRDALPGETSRSVALDYYRGTLEHAQQKDVVRFDFQKGLLGIDHDNTKEDTTKKES